MRYPRTLQVLPLSLCRSGDDELDAIYETVIAPAVRGADLAPRRIDQDNEGGFINAVIMDWIEK